MSTILFLGGGPYQYPAIQYAQNKGYKIIVADRNPDAPGFQLADSKHVVSTDACEKLLSIAQVEQIDGVLGYAAEVGTKTAANLAKKLSLIGNNPRSVDVLQNKAFLQKLCGRLNINQTKSRSFETHEFDKIEHYLSATPLPLVVKPALSSGSRGVSILRTLKDWKRPVQKAFGLSRNNFIMIEQLVEQNGHQICGDGFVQDGKLVFACFGDGHFPAEAGGLAPFGETFPSSHSEAHLERAYKALEKIVETSGMTIGGLNFDIAIRPNGSPHIFDLSPRNGGNFIPDTIELHMGISLIEACVESCLPAPYELSVNHSDDAQPAASFTIHTYKNGTFNGISISPEIESNIVGMDLFIQPGTRVRPFMTAGDGIGNVRLTFESCDEMKNKFSRIRNLIFPIII